jgi:cold shock protein
MPKGAVKWFNLQKGYGFIAPAGSGKDVYAHMSAVERAGLSSLNQGQSAALPLTVLRSRERGLANLKSTN